MVGPLFGSLTHCKLLGRFGREGSTESLFVACGDKARYTLEGSFGRGLKYVAGRGTDEYGANEVLFAAQPFRGSHSRGREEGRVVSHTPEFYTRDTDH